MKKITYILFLVLFVTSISHAGIGELSDCSNASCGTPNCTECTAVCSGAGSCPTGTYCWNDDNFQRCTYDSTIDADAPGSWVNDGTYVSQELNNCQSYAGNCEAIQANVSLGETKSDTITASWGATVSTGVKASVQAAMVAEVAVEASASFTAGIETSSSVSQSTTYSGTLSGVPCCGWKRQHMVIWKRSEPVSADVDYDLQGQCASGNPPTACESSIWHTMKECSTTCNFSDSTNRERSSIVTCDKTCTTYHQCCDGSATEDPVGGCQIPTP